MKNLININYIIDYLDVLFAITILVVLLILSIFTKGQISRNTIETLSLCMLAVFFGFKIYFGNKYGVITIRIGNIKSYTREKNIKSFYFGMMFSLLMFALTTSASIESIYRILTK